MVEKERVIAEKRKYFPGLIDTAFDLSSGGMGIHLHAVTDLAAGLELAKWAKESVTRPSSNYLVTPYIFSWEARPGYKDLDFGPYAQSPYSNQHLLLLDSMREEYARISREQFRIILGGEEALLSVTDPGKPVDEVEYRSLLISATQRGLIEYDAKTSSEIEEGEDDFTLMRNLSRAKVETSDNLWKELDVIKLSDRFRVRLLQAAIHKLGAMLGLTEQLVFDAKVLGIPVPAGYKPTRSVDVLEENWQRLFGEQMPDIDGLYRQAHAVFTANADRQDPLVEYLFSLKTLPNLSS